MIVTALRDGYGIPDPGVMRYDAWNENTGDDIVAPAGPGGRMSRARLPADAPDISQ
jgi:hypothetical protein